MGIAWARKQKEELKLTRGEAAVEVRVRVTVSECGWCTACICVTIQIYINGKRFVQHSHSFSDFHTTPARIRSSYI